MMTHDDLLERLRMEAKHESRSEVARRYGFSLTFVCKVLDGGAPVSGRLAEAMGYRRIVMYERIGS